MAILTAQGLSKAYGDHDVLKGISLSIPRQARIGMVGRNGVGKTTLLKLLAGEEKPEGGKLQRARGSRIGYLPQEVLRQGGDQTLWKLCLEVFGSLRKQESELAKLEQAMADPRQAERAMTRYADAMEEYELAGGYHYLSRIRKVLRGLGFGRADFEKRLSGFSGGERTRAELARLILEDPDLLLLDEPTNHLDLAAVEWLEGWLATWPGAAVIVSHDRYFLNQSVRTIFEIMGHGVEQYRGGYREYVQQKSERTSLRAKQIAAQERHIEKEQDYIRRNMAGQNTRQAQGRQKRLQRFMREQALEPITRPKELHIDFEGVVRSGDEVIKTENLVIAHPRYGSPLFHVPDLLVQRGDRVAIIGPNGAGKTTLLRTLIGELAPHAGSVQLGASLQAAYLRQAQEDLDPEQTVLEEIMRAHDGLLEEEARRFLGKFLFSGEKVFQTIRDLSGGEQTRVALAKLVLSEANLLLLDEPTNHLDLASQENLEIALRDFPGTLLIVSHDRYLIDRLGAMIWALDPHNAKLSVFEHGYQDYREQKRKSPRADVQSRETAQQSKLNAYQLRKLEEQVEALESQLAGLEKNLASAGADVDRVRKLGEQYAALEAELNQKLLDWENAQPEAS